MSQSTSHKDQQSLSSMRELARSQQGREQSGSQSIHQTPSMKTPSKSKNENSSLRNYYNSASYGMLMKSEFSENIYQEERKEEIRSNRP